MIDTQLYLNMLISVTLPHLFKKKLPFENPLQLHFGRLEDSIAMYEKVPLARCVEGYLTHTLMRY